MKQKFKGEVIRKSSAVQRLLHYYSLATAEEINKGLNWYNEANQYAKQMAEENNLPLFVVCGIISALSPQKNWQENKKLAWEFIYKGKRGGHTSAQIDKAEACLLADNANDIFNLLTKEGKKTSWFFYNILHPTIETGTTIDRHAIGTCVYNHNKIKTIPDAWATMTIHQYNFFQEVYASAAQHRGILPHQMQAIVWTVFRRCKGLVDEYKVQTDAPVF